MNPVLRPTLYRVLLTLAVSFSAGGACATGPDIVITLRESALIGDARVRLNDVASISAASDGLAERIGGLVLGPAPLLGERVLLRRDVLAAHLERRSRHFYGARAHWAGASAVTLVRATQRVDSAALQQAAGAALHEWLARHPLTRYEIEMPESSPALLVPAGPLKLVARSFPNGLAPAGRITVWIEAQVDGRIAQQIPVVLTVRSFARRWVARTDLAARGAVNAQAFERREVQLAPSYRPGPADLPPSARLSQALREGQALEASHFEDEIDIARGDSVTASVQHGLVTVQARAEAMQDGRYGQRVQVRIAGATAPVAAQVIGPRTVRVNE